MKKTSNQHHGQLHLTKVCNAQEAADSPSDTSASSRYMVTLAALQASARVPAENQVFLQPEAPAPATVTDAELERQSLLRIAAELPSRLPPG